MQQSPCANVSGNAFDRAEEGEQPFPACGRGNMDVDWRNARHDADAKDAEGGTFTHSYCRAGKPYLIRNKLAVFPTKNGDEMAGPLLAGVRPELTYIC